MLLLFFAGCTTELDTASSGTCDGTPAMTLLHGPWSGHDGPISDGDPLRIITSPGGGWASTIDLDVDNLSALAEISITLTAPESGFTAIDDYQFKLSQTETCQHTTQGLSSLYVFYSPWEFEDTPPAMLGCADLTLTVRYEDHDGVVLEEVRQLLGECDEMSADTCGC